MIFSDSFTYNNIFYRYFIENNAIVETRDTARCQLNLHKQMYQEDNIDNSNLLSYFISFRPSVLVSELKQITS